MTNPFTKDMPANVNQGAVAIEQERATAEAQGALVIAKKFPRDEARSFESAMASCSRMSLAQSAVYSYPRGGQTVSGASIRLAEELARCWGNIDFGIRELSQKDGYSEMEAYAWDMETNTRSKQQFTVKHIRDKRGGGQQLKDQRDIYEIAANMGARRLRARILSVLPPDYVEAALNQVKLTLQGSSDKPIKDRIKDMVGAFNKLGINSDNVEKIAKKPLKDITPEDLSELIGVYQSIKDGMTTLSDWAGEKQQKEKAPESLLNEIGKPSQQEAPEQNVNDVFDEDENNG